ncbi:quinone oxidoreductase family protein [Methylobrevis pamukkalensis]|uniref:Quinone oxidoreductase 1 n=1 Tax=Methylobrevis pamukkalensis TaxID=1439726 RepID=A0A1E3H036_9HYPH|nr:quinone oxidoreductase [Methylobrevis pamukkalensis]ODN69683.1 Quinone oxidoreductase 1 [Methylobrevis pamukkalensis]
MKAIRVHAYGGPEVLCLDEIEVGAPGPGQALVRHEAIGVNFIDVYHRTGLYPSPTGLPFVLGCEGAGVVEAVGEGVSEVKPGDRVAYAGPIGAYAEARLVTASRLVPLPDGIDARTAAAAMLNGMTAQYLLRQTFRVEEGHTILIHAAAGGVGLIAGQWAQHLGATVIGTAGGPEKCALALRNGYDHVIDYRTENFAERVREITGGKGCDVVYDSIGRDTFPASLDCLKPRGLFVSFGNASGPVEGVNLGILSQKGSLYATRPTLYAYINTRDELLATAGDLFDVIDRSIVDIAVNQTFALGEAGAAHRALESRATTGSTLLLP